ncbi:peptide ABC transporter substrate-binding protein [Longimycelium tulufanense]|uniref:Peptide ABC transporter substrate-binding protein n=1 Tax=Longimycelium tulufanense TaxID=907463 RepID=A0A8J3CEC8_9PSEU|nr:ABC transporter substrate-binding protein [Longimycelium tulufanense]GGM56257.1 peptide ABC transporter substrate-binding protein [Longimycelium tulufanense]
MRGGIAVLVAVLVATLAGCSGSGREAAEPGVLSVGLREPGSLLPAQAHTVAQRTIVGALWTPLVTVDQDRVEPVAAESVTSQDQVNWTVRLRPGMRFHDGTPVTAKSYVDTWQAVATERWPGSRVLTDVLRPVRMRAADETTVEIVLDRPFGQVPFVLASPALLPLPESVLSTRDWSGFARHPVGTGPYKMTEAWRPGNGARLTRFDAYSGRRPGKVRDIALRVIDDPMAQYDQVRSGDLDLATQVPKARHESMRKDFPDRHVLWPLSEVSYLGIAVADTRLAEAAVRHALALAVGREELERGPLGYQVDLAQGLAPPAVPLTQRSGPCRPCTHDPEAAKALLEQSGGLTGPVPLRFDADSAQGQWAPALAEQLRRVPGVPEIVPTSLPGPEFRALLANRPSDGLFTITRTLWSPSPYEALSGLAGPTGYADEGFDQMLAASEATTDPAEIGRLSRLAENQLLRDLPVIPLWSAHGHAVWSDRVFNVTAEALGGIDLAFVDLRD